MSRVKTNKITVYPQIIDPRCCITAGFSQATHYKRNPGAVTHPATTTGNPSTLHNQRPSFSCTCSKTEFERSGAGHEILVPHPNIMTEPANASRNMTPNDASGPQPSLPTIRLPHKFEQHGTVIYGPPQRGCSHHADGEPWRYFRASGSFAVGVPPALPVTDCPACRVVFLAVEKLGIVNCVVHTNNFHLGFARKNHGPLLSTDSGSWWRLFSTCNNGVKRSFNPYDIPRCNWTDVNPLCNDSVRFAEACIKNSLGSHELCGSDMDDAFLPTRMVCVDGASSMDRPAGNVSRRSSIHAQPWN